MHLDDRATYGLQPVHRRIPELLATGVTDDTIAELLGISRRTLSRHVEAINARAGSVTRFQMALHAARNGWIRQGCNELRPLRYGAADVPWSPRTVS
ncbi:helix-turn-helix domain-containing protein [Streptomyces manipurensis]|uniref:helix-turn-helix domain-containing protein n=1 Tax=Streptomyces manipurensis TaxID=1077945 RepID=UPI003C6EE758